MYSYQIVTDSSCDFTKAQYAKRDLVFTSLTLAHKGKSVPSYTEEKELHKFYESIRQGEMPTTSAVNPEGWKDVMEPALKAGKDVLCLAFTSGLSTTYQSAVIAAEELRESYPDRKILVVDTLCAALGQGLIVDHACRRRDAGMSMEEVAAWVEENKLHVCHEVTVDDLNHLKRGGRVSAATALVGGMLNIKPIIRVDNDGKLESYAKARGRKAAMTHLANKVAELGQGYDNETVYIAHGDCREDAEALAQMIQAKCPWVKNFHIGYVGGVIGAHTGPGVLVAFFLGEHR